VEQVILITHWEYNMTPQEFANKIRTKYPQGVASDGRSYADIPDQELSEKIISKYPVYKSQVVMPIKPSFKASIGGGETIIPNLAKMAGNIPSDIASTIETAVVDPAKKIGESIGIAKDIYKDRGFVQGTKDIASGFVGTAKNIFKAPGEAIVKQSDKLDTLNALSPILEQTLKQRDEIMQKITDAHKTGKDTTHLVDALRYNQENLNSLKEKGAKTKEERDAQAAEDFTNIAKYPIEHPVQTAVAAATLPAQAEANIASKIKPVTSTIEEGVNVVKNTPSNLKTLIQDKAGASGQKFIDNSVDELFTKTKGISGKVSLAEQKNVPIRDIIKDPNIFKGLQVEKGKIIPDEAIQTIDNQIDTALTSKRAILPELDKYVPKVHKEIIRNKAIEDIKGVYSPADEKALIKAIDEQLAEVPEQLSLQEVDDLRAQFRKSARDAKGIQKRSSEYSALENATRDTVFDATDNLPFDTNGEYQALNKFIKDRIEAKNFLDKTLRGQVVKGGQMSKLIAKGIGAVAGSQGGVFTTILGAETGGFVADIITNNQLGNSIKMKLIRGVTDNPEILQKAEELLSKVKDYKLPQLPAPTSEFRTQTTGNEPIPLGARSQSTIDAQEMERIQSQLEPKISRQNTANNTTTTVNKNVISPKSTTKSLKVKGENKVKK